MKLFFIIMALIGIALFLILLVLVQRGRGGGLAGALGGAGGQSAFGAKAGDAFTKITMWTAFIWIVFCVVAVRMLSGGSEPMIPEPVGTAGAGMATTDEGNAAVPPATGKKPETSAPKKAPPSESGLPADTNPASSNDAGSDNASGGT